MSQAQTVTVKSLDAWIQYNCLCDGSGRSKKVWLRSDDGRDALFKYPKTDPATLKPTTEHISEHLAFQLGKILGVSTAEVDIGTIDGDIGSVSYNVCTPQEVLIEGAALIQHCFPKYNQETLTDKSTGTRYCLDFIFQSVKSVSRFVPEEIWLEMMVFDFLIGNSDRHQGNWAILFNKCATVSGEPLIRPCPLYDNGSSLCSYVNESQIARYFGPDPRPFDALCDSRSRSVIRIDGSEKSLPRHSEMVQHLLRTRPAAKGICRRFLDRLTPEIVDSLLSSYPGIVLNEDKNELIRRYLKQKLRILEKLIKEAK